MSDTDNISDTHEWRAIEMFQVGDAIHRWGDDLPVMKVWNSANRYSVQYTDIDGIDKSISNVAGKQYIARKRGV